MSREILSSPNYQYMEQGFIVDNLPWQEEIKRRLAEESKPKITEVHPTLGTDDFQPFLLPENPEATEAAETIEVVKPPEPTAEEILATAKAEAEETAKSIEQAAKKSAYETLEQARWEANDIISKAKEEAEKEIQHLKELAEETGRKDGLEKGRVEGFEKGRVEGRETYSDAVKKWDGLANEAVSERKRHLADLKPILIELVSEGLYRCLKNEAIRNGQVAVEFAQEALKKAQDRVHLRLHLNPADVEEVTAQKERLQLSVGAGELELVPDGRIEKGGCLLETEAGSVDVRLPTVVAQMKESLSSELPQ